MANINLANLMSVSALFVQSLNDIIPVFFYFVLVNLFITLFISWHQWTLSKSQINELGLRDVRSIQIKLFSETFYSYGPSARFPHGATLYICDHFIFIRPRTGDWYSGIYRANLPIIFAKDPASISGLTKINNIYAPVSIQPGMDNSIEIVFRHNPVSTAKTFFYIDLDTGENFDKIRSDLIKALQ